MRLPTRYRRDLRRAKAFRKLANKLDKLVFRKGTTWTELSWPLWVAFEPFGPYPDYPKDEAELARRDAYIAAWEETIADLRAIACELECPC